MRVTFTFAILASTAVGQERSLFERGELPRTPRPWAACGSSCAADLDGDGDLDLAIVKLVSAARSEVQVLRNDGRGVFAVHQTLVLRTGVAVGPIRAGDIDSDADADLWLGCRAHAPAGANRDHVLFNDGSGRFRQLEVGPIHASPATGGALFDADGDGDLDLIRAGALGYSLQLNDGSGPFRVVVGALPVPAHRVGVARPVVLDVDDDGDVDIYANDAGELWLNDGRGAFCRARMPVDHCDAPLVLDADGDGDDDLLLASANHWTARLLHHDARQGYRIQPLASVPGQPLTPGMAAVQADGDPADEIATLSGRIFDIVGNQLVDMAPDSEPTDRRNHGSSPTTVSVLDFEQNGSDDIFLAAERRDETHVTLHQRAPARFDRYPHPTGVAYDRHRVLDLDRDSIDDVIALGGTGGNATELGWSAGRGDGGFVDRSAEIRSPIQEQIVDMLPADLDGDGRIELLCLTRSRLDHGAELSSLEAAPNGTLLRRRLGGRFGSVNVIADTTGDGRDDLVFYDGSALHVLENTRDRGWVDVSATALPTTARSVRNPILGDLDGDGDVDLVPAQHNRAFDNVGGGAFVPGRALPGRLRVALADLDGDGDGDLLVLDAAGYAVAENTGSAWRMLPVGPMLGAVHAVDFDGDGRLDLVAKGSAFRNTPSGFVPAGGAFADVPLETTVLGDFDGDGDLDLARATDTGFLLHHNRTRQLHQTLPSDRGHPIEFEITNTAAPTAPTFLLLGAPSPALRIPTIGRMYVDHVRADRCYLGTPNQGLLARTTVPAASYLVGLTLRAQVAFAEGNLRLSNYREFTVW